jgi:hypothetical protein
MDSNTVTKQKFHRETQTKYVETKSQQTYREQGTQTAKPGLLLNDAEDKVVYIAGEYFDSKRMEKLRNEKAILIQSWTRGWFARRLAKKMREIRDKELQEKEELEKEESRKEALRKRKEVERKLKPKTKEDFKILYDQLDSWRLAKTEKIKTSDKLDENQKKKALFELLRKETKLLQTIDKLKLSAFEENKNDNIYMKLKKMSDHKKVTNADKVTILVETPFTIRARELMDLYHGLNTDMLTVDERLDVLLHVKWTVKEFDCELTRDIVELIDREADLLNRGRNDNSMIGLRKRLSNLFLEFIEQPEFNPQAIHYTKIPLEHTARPHIQLITGERKN